jgi:anthranilate synthase component II
MIAVIDNYDSFTYNLVQYFGELMGPDAEHRLRVFRNDQITVDELKALKPEAIVISPGPGSPQKDSGISNAAIKAFSGEVPIFGVCLGQQCMGYTFGGDVVRAPMVMHGKTSMVHHNGKDLFKDIPSPMEATRYHSLIVLEPLPEHLEATAHSDDGILMGVRHKTHPTFGVQFHPESILTTHGKQMIRNFLEMVS